jgi:hypothetical protein
MELILIVIATFLSGALVGFGLSTILNAQTVYELHVENEKLKTAKPKKEYVAPQIIEISDPHVADGIEFPGTTKIN